MDLQWPPIPAADLTRPLPTACDVEVGGSEAQNSADERECYPALPQLRRRAAPFASTPQLRLIGIDNARGLESPIIGTCHGRSNHLDQP